MASLPQILRLQRTQLAKLIEVRGVEKLRKLYTAAEADLTKELRAIEASGKGSTFSAHHLRAILGQVQDAVRQFEADLGKQLATNGSLVAKIAPRHLMAAHKELERHFTGHTPVIQADQAAVFAKVYKDIEPSLLDRFHKSSRLYGPPVVSKIREHLALSLIKGEAIDQAVNRVVGTSGIFTNQRWRAERIVATELSYAYGVANQRGMKELAHRDVPDLHKRLVATFDDRTGDDSKQLDGQTVRWDQPFKWVVKNAKGHPTGKVVLYDQPPNRPHDRECVTPWRPGWG